MMTIAGRKPEFVRLLASAAFADLALNMPITIVPLLLLSQGVSTPQVAATMFAPVVAALVVTLPSGWAIDRLGSRTALILAAVSFSVFTLAFLFCSSPPEFAVVLSLRTMCGIVFGTASFTIATSADDEKARVYGVTWLAMALTLSYSIGPALSSYSWKHGLHEVQFIWCIVASALSMLCACSIPKPHRRTNAPRRERFEWRSISHWVAPLGFCLAVTSIGGVNNTLAIAGLHAKGLDGGLLFSSAAAGMLLARIPSAAIVTRYGAVVAGAALAVLMLCGGLLVASSQSTLQMVCGGAVIGIAWSAMLPTCTSLILASTPEGMRAQAMAAYTFAMALGATLGGTVATRIAGMPNAYAIAVVIASAMPLIVFPSLVVPVVRRPVDA